MQSVKNITKGMLIASVALAFVLIATPQAKAAYDCPANVAQADLATCCYPESSEPYQGVFCRADDLFLQKIGSYPPICKTPAEIMTLAASATAKNYVGFNCFNNSLNTTCKNSSYCPQPNGCILWAADPVCTAANKDTICGTTCGGCSAGYFQCGNACVNTIVADPVCTGKGRETTCSGCGGCSDPAKLLCGDTCIVPFDTTPTIACPYGKDACTGACQACPSGKTPSGTSPSRECISYADRFLEIISYGLAKYGKFNSPAYDGRYDYSVTGVEPLMSDVYLKSDIAENLNWNNTTTLPPVFQSLIRNNGNNSYFTCDVKADCPVGSMECSEAGLCYTPGGTAGTVCASISACNLGLMCDASGHCADPNGGLTACTVVGQVGTAPCTAAQTCGTDHYCHLTTAAIGDVCASNAACPAGSLCNYATPRVCEAVSTSSKQLLQYMGMSATTAFNVAFANGTGYASANLACSTPFPGSHVCTSEEMLTLVSNQAVLPGSGSGWVNAGPPGFPADTNDCKAWTVKPQPPFLITALGPLYDPANAFGRFWDFGAKAGYLKPCNQLGMAYLCCK